MTLYEIGCEYEKSAEPLRKRLSELRSLAKAETDPEKLWHLKRRISELTPILTECNKMARRCKTYYSRNAVGRAGERGIPKSTKSQKVGAIDFNHGKRTYTTAERSCGKGSVGGQDFPERGRRTKRLSQYNI